MGLAAIHRQPATTTSAAQVSNALRELHGPEIPISPYATHRGLTLQDE